MDAFMFSTPGTPHGAVAQTFMDLVELRRSGFLTSDSKVWINADAPEAGIWMLNNKSSFLKVFRTTHAGWIRLGRTEAKWGRTSRDTTGNGELVMSIRHLPDGVNPEGVKCFITIAVLHRDKSQPLGVLADGSVQKSDLNGRFFHDPFTVVDMSRYTAPENVKPNSFEEAHAMVNGAALMACTSTEDGAAFIRENMDVFHLEIKDEYIAKMDQALHTVESFSRAATESLMKRLEKLGGNGIWLPDGASV
jgi:hypothetical protein